MNESILNLDYLAEITGGDIELRDELINLFENDSQIQLQAIEDSRVSGDPEKLRYAIHKYRSSLFSVGLLDTANQYKELETLLKQGIWQESFNDKLMLLHSESEIGLSQLKQLQNS